MGFADAGGSLVELAAGIDALYMSGRGTLPGTLLERLEVAKLAALDSGTAQPFSMGGYDWQLQVGGRHMYRYLLSHEAAEVGMTASEKLPPVWVQPRSEALNSAGADGMVSWARNLLANEGAAIALGVSRIDLHSDWQGWYPTGDERHRFVCRARSLVTYEENAEFSGFTFGKRKTGSMTARIYDKTLEIEGNGHDWWIELWGERFDVARPVIRVEFECSRELLHEMGLSDPDDVLAAVGDLWAYCADEWLTFREPSEHHAASRWPVAAEWAAIQGSSLAVGSLPLARIKKGRSKGGLRLLMPLLNGCIASFAGWVGVVTIADACGRLPAYLTAYERTSGRSFADRVAEKIAARK